MREWARNKIQGRLRRHRRVRAKIRGTAQKPRLSVFRSLKNIFVQIIDDEKGQTLAGLSTKGLKPTKGNPFKGKAALSYEAGLLIAKKALEKGIKEVCFDRGGYLYHGRVKAVAEGARAGGLKF